MNTIIQYRILRKYWEKKKGCKLDLLLKNELKQQIYDNEYSSDNAAILRCNGLRFKRKPDGYWRMI